MALGKEILGKDKKEYERVIDNQLLIMIDFFGEQFSSSIEFEKIFNEDDLNKMDLDKLAKTIYDDTLKIELPNIGRKANWTEMHKFDLETNKKVAAEVQAKLSKIHPELVIKKFNFRQMNRVLHEKVLPFIKDSKDENLIIKELKNEIRFKISELPF